MVATNWGDTIDATRAQLRHALQDPLNQRFLLLSDTDVPLYPARMVYLQLMGEPKSRVAACKGWDLVNINRYTCRSAACAADLEGVRPLPCRLADEVGCRMAEMGVDSQHWRKGAQWLSFLRPHAQMVADDEMVRAAFNQHCAGVFDDVELEIHRGCLSDVSALASSCVSAPDNEECAWFHPGCAGALLPHAVCCDGQGERDRLQRQPLVLGLLAQHCWTSQKVCGATRTSIDAGTTAEPTRSCRTVHETSRKLALLARRLQTSPRRWSQRCGRLFTGWGTRCAQRMKRCGGRPGRASRRYPCS